MGKNKDTSIELQKWVRLKGYASLVSFAETTGIPYRTLQNIDAGSWPQKDNLKAIAAGLGMSIDQLIDAVEPDDPLRELIGLLATLNKQQLAALRDFALLLPGSGTPPTGEPEESGADKKG